MSAPKMVTVSSRLVTAYNVSDSPVVIDGPGHILGGREYGTVNLNVTEVRGAVDRGVLVVQDDPGELDGLNEQAVAAHRATREANGQPADTQPEPQTAKGRRNAGQGDDTTKGG